MTQTEVTPSAQLTGNVLFYEKPEPLTPELHGNLGISRVEPAFAFVAKSHVVPLTVTEFAPAALSYPVVFVGEPKNPLAVMGLRQGENLFVSPEGQFRAEAYIPAYIRRYPFVFANDEQQQRMILCVDRGAPQVVENADAPFFADGKPTEYVETAMKFCRDFESERQRTDNFVKLLNELDLFDVREAVFTPRNPDGSAGQPQKIADYYAVSEEKLAKLPAKKLAELRDNGALGQIYAHLVSLLGWDRLIAMAFERAAQQQPAAANA